MFSNDRFDWRDVLEPHVRCTLQRIAGTVSSRSAVSAGTASSQSRITADPCTTAARAHQLDAGLWRLANERQSLTPSHRVHMKHLLSSWSGDAGDTGRSDLPAAARAARAVGDVDGQHGCHGRDLAVQPM